MDYNKFKYEKKKKQYGEASYFEYRDKIFAMLQRLKPGSHYDISQVEAKGSRLFFINDNSDPDLFVKIVCDYIICVGNIVFSEDFSKIFKI